MRKFKPCLETINLVKKYSTEAEDSITLHQNLNSLKKIYKMDLFTDDQFYYEICKLYDIHHLKYRFLCKKFTEIEKSAVNAVSHNDKSTKNKTTTVSSNVKSKSLITSYLIKKSIFDVIHPENYQQWKAKQIKKQFFQFQKIMKTSNVNKTSNVKKKITDYFHLLK